MLVNTEQIRYCTEEESDGKKHIVLHFGEGHTFQAIEGHLKSVLEQLTDAIEGSGL